MEFKKGANVYSAQNDKIGDLQQVVLDPKTKEVTHIVVSKGILFTQDKVVPMGLVASATEEGIVLRDAERAGDLESLPNLEEEHYVPVEDDEWLGGAPPANYPHPLYWYPPIYGAPYGLPNTRYPTDRPVYAETEVQNIPRGEVALQPGARVISANGERVGGIDSVLTDPEADRITHFVIAEGVLLKQKKLIPIEWVDRVYQNEVHLTVGLGLIEELREYKD